MSGVGGRTIRTFAILAGGELTARACAFVTALRLARTLGVEGFGALGFAGAVLAYLLLVPNLGLDVFGAREAARDIAGRKALVEAALALRLLGALAAAALLVPLAAALTVRAEVRLVVLLSGCSLLPYALTLRWLFLGLERPRVIAIAAAAGQAIGLAGVVVFVRGPADLPRVPLVQAGGELLTAVILLSAARGPLGRFRPRLDRAAARAALTQSLPIAAADAVRTVVYGFDVLLIGLMLREAAVGRYVAGYRVILLAVTLGAFYYAALMPALSRAFAAGGTTAVALLAGPAARAAALLAVPAATGAIVLAAPLLTTLYGAEYAAAAPAFRLLAPAIALIAIAGSCRNALIAAGRQRLDARIVAGGAALNVLLNLALIPRWGLAGAALATLAAEGLILAWGWRAVARLIGPLALGPTLAVALGAATVMGAVLLPLRGAPLFVSLPAGVASYTAVALTLDRRLPGQLRQLLARPPRDAVAPATQRGGDGP